MKLIAHRGNYKGIEPEFENSPERIDYCINNGFDVEIDLWIYDEEWCLGHDYPQYKIDKNFLETRKNNLWIHCKNENALFRLYYSNCNYFWHENDDYTITSKKYLWTYPNKQKEYNNNQIILDFDQISPEKFEFYQKNQVFGVCSDNFENYKYYNNTNLG